MKRIDTRQQDRATASFTLA